MMETREGFSDRFENQDSPPCAKCWEKGQFHWPLLADHEPVSVGETGCGR